MALLSYALTTVDRYKVFAGISDTAQDTLIELLINAATDYIESYTGRRFLKSTYTQEIYDADDSGVLILKNTPLASGDSFTLEARNSGVNEDDWETMDSQYFSVDYEAGVVKAMGGFKFRKGRSAFRVTYQAGYNYDNATTFLGTVGAGDLEFACWELVKSAINNSSLDSNVQSERLREYAVTYFASSVYANNIVLDILDKYKNIAVGGSATPILH